MALPCDEGTRAIPDEHDCRYDDRAVDTTGSGKAMRRPPRAWIIIGLLVLATVMSVAAWISQRPESAPEVLFPSLEKLVWQTESFEGELVRVTGTVRAFAVGTPGEHFVLEDAKQNRVEIFGVPRGTLHALTNGNMTIEGVFHFKDGVGRYIDVTTWATPTATTAD
jgi:hypothetical protein